MSSTDFRKLIVWQKSKDLAVDIYKLTSTGNDEETHSGLEAKCIEISKMLSGLIKTIKSN